MPIGNKKKVCIFFFTGIKQQRVIYLLFLLFIYCLYTFMLISVLLFLFILINVKHCLFIIYFFNMYIN